jgi:phosphoribosylanthranilate isomerase
MAVKVKICGITNEEDATWAVNLGANYIGLNFHSGSPRKVSPDLAARIAKKVPPFVPTIGVFVEQKADEILKIAEKVGLMGVQLHGDHTPEDCRAISEKMEITIIRAFRLGSEADLDAIAPFKSACTHILLDAKVDGQPGGTGQTFPWELARRAKAFGLPIFVAGGLTPENVREAVSETQPFAVDVASGVEKSPKRKDLDKVKKFISEAKAG